jgi:hypothetical protein
VISSVPTVAPGGRRLPRIRDAAKAAWIDLYRVFRNLPRVWAVALAISFGLSIPALLMDGDARTSAGALILSLVTGVANGFLLTPYNIAVHRLIILDEIAHSYVLRPREPRFQKFFGWWLILLACEMGLVGVFALLSAPVLLMLPLASANAAFIVITLTCALIFILCWVISRLSILFPAIAVDAAGASWRNVMADTRGYAWQIFLIGLLASLPFVPVGIALWFAVGHGTVVAAVIDGVIGIVSITLLVVIASRLYQRLGNRVNQPTVV